MTSFATTTLNGRGDNERVGQARRGRACRRVPFRIPRAGCQTRPAMLRLVTHAYNRRGARRGAPIEGGDEPLSEEEATTSHRVPLLWLLYQRRRHRMYILHLLGLFVPRFGNASAFRVRPTGVQRRIVILSRVGLHLLHRLGRAPRAAFVRDGARRLLGRPHLLDFVCGPNRARCIRCWPVPGTHFPAGRDGAGRSARALTRRRARHPDGRVLCLGAARVAARGGVRFRRLPQQPATRQRAAAQLVVLCSRSGDRRADHLPR